MKLIQFVEKSKSPETNPFKALLAEANMKPKNRNGEAPEVNRQVLKIPLPTLPKIEDICEKIKVLEEEEKLKGTVNK